MSATFCIITSLHEPDVECISKGKEHQKYEFGNKVSILYTPGTGVIVGTLGLRNPYDGHTLEPFHPSGANRNNTQRDDD